VWAGRVVFGVIVAGLVVYLVVVGLEKADKVSSGIGAVLALIALGALYLLPPPPWGGASLSELDRVENTGKASATGGGQANTGLRVVGDSRPTRVSRSGDATASGPGSVANTGIERIPTVTTSETSPHTPGAATVVDSGTAAANTGGVANTGIMGDVKVEHHEHHHHPRVTSVWPVLVGQPPGLASAFQPRQGLRDKVLAARRHGDDVVLARR
jgi:hypothetical protein